MNAGGEPTEWNATNLKAWADANGERPIDRFELKAKTLPDGIHEGTAKHPFPVEDREAYLELVKEHGSIGKLSHSGQIGRIRLDAIHGIQHTVNRERLTQHMKDPALIPKGTRSSGSGALIDLPIIVKKNGKYFCHDGHHRLCAAHLRHDPDARVRLVDLDAPIT